MPRRARRALAPLAVLLFATLPARADDRTSGLPVIPFHRLPGAAEVFRAALADGIVDVSRGAVLYRFPAGSTVLRETVWGASADPVPIGPPASTVVSWIRGAEAASWSLAGATHERVSLGSAAPGVEVELSVTSGRAEKIVRVAPHGAIDALGFEIDGARSVGFSADGGLLVKVDGGTLRFSAPCAFQPSGTGERPVEVAYRELRPLDAASLRFAYGFALGPHDPALPLVIDPVVSSTFLGGGWYEEITGITRDAGGNLFVTGHTINHAANPPDFPTTPGAADAGRGGDGSVEAFVAKLSPDLRTLLAATFLGGGSDDYGNAIRIDASGRVAVAGATFSTDFPTTAGAWDRTRGGAQYSGWDGFVTLLSADLRSLVASTYVGGYWYDGIADLAVGPAGDLYVAGNTANDTASMESFPAGGFDATSNGGNEVFVGRLSGDLARLGAFTFLGGAGSEESRAIAVAADGRVLVTGHTRSAEFPTAAGAYDRTYGDGLDVFVTRLSANLAALEGGTLLGGAADDDHPHAVALDSAGNVFVAGATLSADFPSTPGAFDTTQNGGGGHWTGNSELTGDVFVAKFDPGLTRLLASTFLGTGEGELASAAVTDPSGNVWITGHTWSTAFPTTVDADAPANAASCGYPCGRPILAELSNDLAALRYSTYLSETAGGIPRDVVLVAPDRVAVAGRTSFANFPTTAGAADTSFAGNQDAFVSIFDAPRSLAVEILGPSGLATGRKTSFLVRWKNRLAGTASNVVVAVAIPKEARFDSATGGGFLRSDTKEAVWKLGNLLPDAEGRAVLTLDVPWGTPDATAHLTARIDAESPNLGVLPDFPSYLAEEAIFLTSSRLLSGGELAGLLSADLPFASLRSFALRLGFEDFGVARRTTFSDGTEIDELVLLRHQPLESMAVRRSNRGAPFLARQTARNEVEYLDETGGVLVDLSTNEAVAYGAWAEAGSASRTSAGCTYEKCRNRCLLLNGVGIGVDAAVDTLLLAWRAKLFLAKTAYVVTKWAVSHDSNDGVAVAGELAGAVPYGSSVKGAVYAVGCPSVCAEDPSKYCCTAERRSCLGGDPAAIWVEQCKAWTETWGKPYIARCAVGFVCNPANPTIDGCLRETCDESRSVVSPASTTCRVKEVSVRTAKDPNAKASAPSGDVLAGERIAYTIDYENVGGAVAVGVFVLDVVDPNLDSGTLTIGSGGTYASASRTLLWNVGDVPAGGKGSVTFSAAVRSDSADGTEIVNWAEIHFPSSNEITPTNPVRSVVRGLVAEPGVVEATAGIPKPITLSARSRSGSAPAYRITRRPIEGTLSGSAPSLTYTAAAGFAGTDALEYVATSGASESAPATVSIRVSPAAGDTRRPTVLSTVPAAGAVGIPALPAPFLDSPWRYAPIVWASFDEAMKPSTITAASFSVEGLSGVVGYDAATRTASFTPTSPLSSGRTYTATISTAVTDLAGNALASAVSFSFSTESAANIDVPLSGGGGRLVVPDAVPGGAPSAAVLVVFSTGTADLVLGTVTLGGANASEFRISPDGCSARRIVAGATCSLALVFSPASTGERSATLSIPSNDPDTPVVSVPLVGTGASAGPPLPHTYIVPAVAHAPGAGGTEWRTDVAVVNRTAAAAILGLTFHGPAAPLSRSKSVVAGGTVEWRDVLAGELGLPPGERASGTLEIRSSVPLRVASRTYNQTASGTFGQYLPALEPGEGIGPGEAGILPQMKKSSAFRTNLGLVNLGSAAATVSIRLHGASGAPIGAALTMAVPAGRWVQQFDVFGAAGVGGAPIAYATVEPQTAGARIWAYASVVDEATGDPTTIPLLAEGRSGADAAGARCGNEGVRSRIDATLDAPLSVGPRAGAGGPSPAGETTILSDGFEAGFPGSAWKVLTEGSTGWGRSTHRRQEGAASVWCAGGGSSPGTPGGDYASSMKTWMIHGPFPLAGATAARASFSYWMETEAEWSSGSTTWGDPLAWMISTDGQNFSGFKVSGSSGGWTTETFDFAEVSSVPAIGAPQVWFAFLFKSDVSLEEEGVYIDSLAIGKTAAGGACGLTCTATAPPSGSVGAAVPFTGGGTATGCTGGTGFDWDFGDGTPHGTGASVSHAYASAGTFAWKLTARADAVTCVRTGSITVSAAPAAERRIVPAVVHAPGVAGTQWRTDLAVVNRGAASASLTLVFRSDAAPVTRTKSLAAGATVEWVDVVVSELGFPAGASTAGTLEISSSQPIAVTSRTYNQTSAGTFGQYLPALAATDGIPSGSRGVLPQIKSTSAFRTNLGLVNLGDSEATVSIRLFGAIGGSVGAEKRVTVAAGRWVPVNDVFGATGAGSQPIAFATVEPVTAGSRIWAYASVVDSATGDPTTVPLLADP